MREITYREALREALIEEMERDENVFLLGEDIADPMGGSMKVTLGLSTRFGKERVRNTPISEGAIVGCALGAAITGMRPVAEIMYINFTTCCMDQIFNQAAKIRYMSGGQLTVPLVIRMQGGSGRQAAAQHSDSWEALFAHIPGLKVVMPSTPYDAKGLLKSAIRDDNPVIFMENSLLYSKKGEVPEEEYLIPIGKAKVAKEGSDVSIVANWRMVDVALEAAKVVQERGVNAEVIDLRTISPMDEEAIVASVKKTHRLVVMNESTCVGNIAKDVATVAMRSAFDYLDFPPVLVTSVHSPIPFSPTLEKEVTPSTEKAVSAIMDMF
jgi:pyruvate/2-oxoglutarate/acetoin dehydrogenase E1 component